jgi:hypothetical protein
MKDEDRTDLRTALSRFQSAARELRDAWERVDEHYGDEIANYPANWGGLPGGAFTDRRDARTVSHAGGNLRSPIAKFTRRAVPVERRETRRRGELLETDGWLRGISGRGPRAGQLATGAIP